MAWNFACRCILTSFRTDWILVTVCWFFILWRYFNLVKLVKFRVSGHFLKNAWEEWPEILHASVFWPSKFIKFWSRSVDFSLFGANFTSRNGSNLGPPNILGRSPTLEGAEAFQNAGVLDCLVFHTCTVSNLGFNICWWILCWFLCLWYIEDIWWHSTLGVSSYPRSWHNICYAAELVRSSGLLFYIYSVHIEPELGLNLSRSGSLRC